jgi:hypothetical protein
MADAILEPKGNRHSRSPLSDPIVSSAFLRSIVGGDQMPQKEHLPHVSDKEQRMYEHIKSSERKQGRSLDRAKEIAAATVVKHHNRKDHPSEN